MKKARPFASASSTDASRCSWVPDLPTSNHAVEEGKMLGSNLAPPHQLGEADAADTCGLPFRNIIRGDAVQWLEGVDDSGMNGCIFTSIPDISENVSATVGFGSHSRMAVYKKWFTDTAALVFRKLKPMSYAIFLQSDIRFTAEHSQLFEWVDKSHLISTAADKENCKLMWHKLVMDFDELHSRSVGRPKYSHLVCYAKGPVTYRSGSFAAPDILDKGHMLVSEVTQSRITLIHSLFSGFSGPEPLG